MDIATHLMFRIKGNNKNAFWSAVRCKSYIHDVHTNKYHKASKLENSQCAGNRYILTKSSLIGAFISEIYNRSNLKGL